MGGWRVCIVHPRLFVSLLQSCAFIYIRHDSWCYWSIHWHTSWSVVNSDDVWWKVIVLMYYMYDIWLCVYTCTSHCRLPVAEQRGYKSVFDALFRITREEGLFTLWRVIIIHVYYYGYTLVCTLYVTLNLKGCGPTVLRAMVVNAAQLGTYSQAKQFLLATGNLLLWLLYLISMMCVYSNADYFSDDIKCHFSASMISGLVTTLVSMPVDIAKTRLDVKHYFW